MEGTLDKTKEKHLWSTHLNKNWLQNILIEGTLPPLPWMPRLDFLVDEIHHLQPEEKFMKALKTIVM